MMQTKTKNKSSFKPKRNKVSKYFVLEKSHRVKRFIETYCTYSKGEWAGKPFKVLPWVWEDVIKPLFGTLNKNGYRQYRTVYIEVPKKNAKTENCAAIGLYMLTSDGEDGAEVYIAACDREQAGICYQAAATMVRNNPTLSDKIKCVDSRRRLVYLETNSYLQVLSSDVKSKHGSSPSCVIFDEIHAHPNDQLWNVLTAGTDYARRQQIIFVITTAGVYNKESIWWKLRTRAKQAKDGIIKDKRLLPVLYCAEPDEDPESEELWKRVNPSLGYIFTLDKIRQDYLEAKNNPVDFQNFKRFRLNIPIRQLCKWMPMDKWDACNGKVDMDSLVGRPCFAGLDLSLKFDLTAFIMVFRPGDDGIFDILCKFYCPEGGILKRSQTDRVPYDIWQQQGHIIATPGDTVDYSFIEKDMIDTINKYNINEVAYDPWKASATKDKMMLEFNPSDNEQGFQMVEVRQGAKTLHEPSQDLLVNVINVKIRHGGHPILRWNMDNMVMRGDANENLAPDKAKSVERIDGGVALIMAWSRAMFGQQEESIYETRGILSF